MTVGERYREVWQEAWDRQVPGAKGISFTDEAHRCLDAAVPGLWDSEVLEGRVSLFDKRGDDAPMFKGVDSSEPFRACLVPVPPDVDLAYTSLSQVKFLPEFNTWARVIVVGEKADESGGDRSGPQGR